MNQREIVLHLSLIDGIGPSAVQGIVAACSDNLDQIREKGYAVSRGEWIIDASGTAAPIFDQRGLITAAISISGPGQRFTDEKIKEMADLLVKETAQISFELGYYPR